MKILEFGSTAGFGKWKNYFPEEAIEFSAKMNLNLLKWLILNYTEEGDVILDPMAGTFSTVVLSMLHNRHGIGVELEEKFCKWGREAIKRAERQPTLTEKGLGVVICGDSRRLSELLNEEVSACIFSPPFGPAQKGGGIAVKGYEGEYGEDRKLHLRHDRPLSDNELNIGNLPLGDISAIITSPPYSEGIGHDSGDNASKQFKERLNLQRRYTRQMVSEGNIGKLTHGNVDELVRTNLSHDSIDTIITSPPYGDTISCHAGGPSSINDIGISCRTARSYTELDETIKRLRRYGRSNNKAGGPYGRSLGHPYSPSGENIGNMKKESYLQAMLTVYEQCHHVLKQHGKLILVVKNFIRDKKIVPLTDHTIVLCEHAGFKLMDHLLFKLPQKSFWRNLHKKKWDKEGREYPKDLSYEHILIFEKTQPGCEKFIYHEDF